MLVAAVAARAATVVWHLVVWLGAPGTAACSLAPAQHSSEAISLGDLVQQADWRVLLARKLPLYLPQRLSAGGRPSFSAGQVRLMEIFN